MIAPQLYDAEDKAYISLQINRSNKLWIGGPNVPDIRWNKEIMKEIIKYCHDTLKYDYNKIFLTFDCKAFYIAYYFSDENVKKQYSDITVGSDSDIKTNINDLIDFFKTCTHDGTSSGQKLAGIIGWGAGVLANGPSENKINIEMSNLFYK